jgi:SAM-dependent methyltransferase
LRLDLIAAIPARPAPFAPSAARFWNDPYISTQMLQAHLDPTSDAASRRPEIIAATVDWLIPHLALHPSDRLLDLGCGPGLYSSRFAGQGLAVTGVDYAEGSLTYARAAAARQGLEVEYRYQDYLELADTARYRAAVLIYGDFCTLAAAGRDRLLANIRQALQPGGRFAFDVMTPAHPVRREPTTAWAALEAGFWRPGPHLLLTRRCDYPETAVFLEQYLVIEETGAWTEYRNWYQFYTVATLTPILEQAGFHLREVWGDLTGAPVSAEEGWLGLLAERDE